MHHIVNQQGCRPSRGEMRHWTFTGEVAGHSRRDGICAWCGQTEFCVTFAVRHGVAERTCSICQTCLGQAPLRLEQENRAFSIEEWRDYLSELAVRMLHRTCRTVMRDLLASTDNPALQEVAVYFDRNVQLSPARAATLLLALSNAQMDIDPRIFDIQIRSAAHKQEFAALSDEEKLAVWPVFSTTVQNRLAALGLAPAAIGHIPSRRRGYTLATLASR